MPHKLDARLKRRLRLLSADERADDGVGCGLRDLWDGARLDHGFFVH